MALLVCLCGCGPGSGALDRLAAGGSIQSDAPVRATAALVISAPRARVWRVLTNIDGWPGWQPAIEKASIEGATATGSHFTWQTGGARIRSTVALLDAPHRIAWTGRVWWIHAIHVWTLTQDADGRTRVETAESMSGWLIPLFFSSSDLARSDQDWLAHLKLAAEASG